jgi:hypothetical protein
MAESENKTERESGSMTECESGSVNEQESVVKKIVYMKVKGDWLNTGFGLTRIGDMISVIVVDDGDTFTIQFLMRMTIETRVTLGPFKHTEYDSYGSIEQLFKTIEESKE